MSSQPIPASDTTEVSPLTLADVDTTARQHAASLPHGFFADLGPRFLAAYHASFIASPHAVALAVRAGDEVVGVLLGTLRNRAHFAWVVRDRGRSLALLAVIGLACKPAAAWRLVRTRWRRYTIGLVRLIRHGRSTGPAGGGAPTTPDGVGADRSGEDVGDGNGTASADARDVVGVLSHTWVVPEARGAGIGSQLCHAFLDEVRAAGVGEAMLVTRAGHEGASGFYERLGWTRGDEYSDRDGDRIVAYRIDVR